MARQEEICWSCGADYAPARPAGASQMTAATASERFDDDGGHPRRVVPPLVGV